MSERALAGMRVLELGSRLGVGACGRLLADLGADVWVAEPREPGREGKWIDRALATAARRSVLFALDDADDMATIAALASRCDAVLTSSDTDRWPPAVLDALARCPIVCDITAFGATGPLAGTAGRRTRDPGAQRRHGHDRIQPTSRPCRSAFPSPKCRPASTRPSRRRSPGACCDATASASASTWRCTTLRSTRWPRSSRRTSRGKPARRLGNGHSMAVPWNAYETRKGWVLVCSANDLQWKKLAALIDPALPDDPRYATLADRLARRAEVDALVAAWVARQPLDALVAQLLDAGIPCGPIVTLDRLPYEPNLALRGSIAQLVDPLTGRTVRVPAALVRFDDEKAAAPAIPVADAGRASARALPPRPARSPRAPRPPFAGLRVVEIGQFTTAPLAARHLASFGADVIKIEPADGDSARAWAPHRNGTSHFFVMSNGEKRSLALDLRSAAGLAAFELLLGGADVLVENMKPGSLARLGFDPQRLRALNPRLVYCAISGFGLASAYEGRPAFDTVVQAMCGMMDATRAEGVPMKSGISAADIGGGQVGLLAIVAALERRERTGLGAIIDIAMQDVGAWLTQTRWNVAAPVEPHAGPVASVADACADPQTLARELIVVRRDASGTDWEMLASPLRLSATPARVGMPIGASVAAATALARRARRIRDSRVDWGQPHDRRTAAAARPARCRAAQSDRRVADVPVQRRGRLRDRLASRPSRAVRDLGRRPGHRRGHARRAARPHHARMPRPLFGRQRGGAGARRRVLPAPRRREARHPAVAFGPQGLGAPAVGRARRSR